MTASDFILVAVISALALAWVWIIVDGREYRRRLSLLEDRVAGECDKRLSVTITADRAERHADMAQDDADTALGRVNALMDHFGLEVKEHGLTLVKRKANESR